MSTLVIGGNGGFIASRPGDTAITIQNINFAQTGQVRGFWSRSRLRPLRPFVARVNDTARYWRWLGDAA